jgi:ferredoxin
VFLQHLQLLNMQNNQKQMAEITVWIEDGCTACGLCVEMVPEVFGMPEQTAQVKPDVNLDLFRNEIKKAAQCCPVEVIQYAE